jgi:hypothetical protein
MRTKIEAKWVKGANGWSFELTAHDGRIYRGEVKFEPKIDSFVATLQHSEDGLIARWEFNSLDNARETLVCCLCNAINVRERHLPALPPEPDKRLS